MVIYLHNNIISLIDESLFPVNRCQKFRKHIKHTEYSWSKLTINSFLRSNVSISKTNYISAAFSNQPTKNINLTLQIFLINFPMNIFSLHIVTFGNKPQIYFCIYIVAILYYLLISNINNKVNYIFAIFRSIHFI